MEQPGARSGPRKPAGTVAQDELIMGTNNSSIVSKRSVERLYFPHEPHFFRYFVKRPQRRSPLINRGYWLRMKAVDFVVRQFLKLPSEKRKMVVNLGCGYDPLPWQSLARYPASCQNTMFVDVDYRELMIKKRETVNSTLELKSMLTNIKLQEGDILLQSDEYLQVGCDLRDLSRLQSIFSSAAMDVRDSLVLFVAEVSITYMKHQWADDLIKWANTLPSARFCLLEQIIPGGIDHPFATMMLAHFNKLNTSLGAVHKYPTAEAQRQRFLSLGWETVSVRNLWELWSAEDFLTPSDRTCLDAIEPFDEWEEFAIFACHYFLLVADNHRACLEEQIERPNQANETPDDIMTNSTNVLETQAVFSAHPKGHGFTRFAAALPLRGPDRSQPRAGTFAGMGLKTRIDTCDVYGMSSDNILNHEFSFSQSVSNPTSRMCHTITDMGDSGALLVGGRTSPTSTMADCWLYHKWLGMWERVDDLPQPLCRHQAVYLGRGCTLISTGRTDSRLVSKDFLVWSRKLGWVRCHLADFQIPPETYGSIFAVRETDVSSESFRRGFIAGGMTVNGVIQEGSWFWEIEEFAGTCPELRFRSLPNRPLGLSRFGACVVNYQHQTLVIGGVAKNRLLDADYEILALTFGPSNILSEVSAVCLNWNSTIPRPLFIGMTAIQTDCGILIVGGSAVCFSFGTYWNKGAYSIKLLAPGETPKPDLRVWSYLQTHTTSLSKPKTVIASDSLQTPRAFHEPLQIRRVKVRNPGEFQTIIRDGRPIILEGLDLGKCIEAWTPDGLKEKIGPSREVVVHESKKAHMCFKTKNFSYANKSFAEFMDCIQKGERLYMRALSSQNAKDLPACLEKDYPALAAEFRIPNEMEYVLNNLHSSVLRISGSVNMWLHYDVMANVLCQIRGEKKLLLFPPSDVTQFDFEPGASSSSLDVFEELQRSGLPGRHPHEAVLKQGDILFLPPLWLHTATPTSTISVAVNCFFRDLPSGYAAGRDVYGNRDLQAYEKGRQDIARILKSFRDLPGGAQQFYLQRLAAELQAHAQIS
ncbi:hypothetical protein BJ875DRAFT_467488 [Amylocarpus encephaloides]|uniref:tRNA wybutosine-synthesizing protein 4 n=1 Tax=Amylocarpus encephaloides TaxID=45428 RepID=A0A9P7YE65_9HELO|nr:hypothetical protein BJ875DRAFT_467488 [Amylocarpus encephaloides]